MGEAGRVPGSIMYRCRVGLKSFAAVPMIAATLLLGGCGGIQFEGRVFEAMGLSQDPQREEKPVQDRAPLVVPPKRELPPPGPREQVADPQNWPVDPDEQRRRELAAAKEELRKEYEKNPEKNRLFKNKPLPDEFRGDPSPRNEVNKHTPAY